LLASSVLSGALPRQIRTAQSPYPALPQVTDLVQLHSSASAEGCNAQELVCAIWLVELWRMWQRDDVVSPATLARAAQFLHTWSAGAGPPELELPTPEEALAALRSCGNPLCSELGGDSEAGLPRRACGRCGAVSYCSPACQRQHWALGHKGQCVGPAAAAGALAGLGGG
jgi:hypothetical protein